MNMPPTKRVVDNNIAMDVVDYGYETCVPVHHHHHHGSPPSVVTASGDDAIRLMCLQAASQQAAVCDFMDDSRRYTLDDDDTPPSSKGVVGEHKKKKGEVEEETDYGYGDMSESAPDSDVYGYETSEPIPRPRHVPSSNFMDDSRRYTPHDDGLNKQEEVVDYGYGDCVPDSATKKDQTNKNNKEVEEIDYGYGDVSESAPDSDMYGYETSAPTPRRRGQEGNTNNPYGYETAATDSAAAVDYGYGDGEPDSPGRTRSPDSVTTDGEHYRQQGVRHNSYQNGRRVPRRSSMKQAGRVGRRSSIGYTGEVVVNLPGRKEPVRRRTSISFDNYQEVAEVEPIKDLAEDSKQLWFQPEEYDMIREKALLITSIASSMPGGEDPNGKLCTRGLESHIFGDQVAREQFIARRSVLVEQEHQRNMGIYDDEVVSKIYQLTSMGSMARANVFAQKDYAVAERHTRNERIRMRRSSVC